MHGENYKRSMIKSRKSPVISDCSDRVPITLSRMQLFFIRQSRLFDVTLMNIRPKRSIKIQLFNGTTSLWKWVNLWPKKSLRKNENQHVVSNTRLYPYLLDLRWWIVPLDHKLTIRKQFKSERQSTSNALSCVARAMADLYDSILSGVFH